MPNNDSNNWQAIWFALTASTTWQGAIMVMIIAVLRILYDNSKVKPLRVLLEAVLCGALSLCVTGVIEVMHLPDSAAITIGGAIGFIGVNSLRDFILKVINKRVDKE